MIPHVGGDNSAIIVDVVIAAIEVKVLRKFVHLWVRPFLKIVQVICTSSRSRRTPNL